MSERRRSRLVAAGSGVAAVAVLVVGVAKAVTVIGGPKGDLIKGTPNADKLYGKGGNDRLYGFAGKDLLVGGPGADLLLCGSGRDVAIVDAKDTVRGCEVVRGRPKPTTTTPPPPPADDHLYVALGTSISAGVGASTASKAWVSLYFGYLSSNGSGVTRLSNVAQPGVTSDQIRRGQLATVAALIDQESDAVRVTIDAGSNDILTLSSCDHPSDPACPFAANLRTILQTLNEALARDPGDETIQIMEYYNWEIGTSKEGANRVRLLGDDLKVDCSGTGSAIGLNDLIHCIALEAKAVPVDVLPAFDAAGAGFLDIDHLHPNDAGYLGIAKAFGGAVERGP
jgi:lysophospholipase L1-like esterase